MFNCKFKDLFERKPNQIPISIRVQPDLRAVGFVKRNALIYSVPATPPWLLKRPHINYSIHYSSKGNTSPEIYKNKFFEFCDHYKGKDTSDPTNCRPIALTSCVCKVMERMVNNRLVWYLERNKIITPTQSGFCKGRSTTDQLVRLEPFVREAFIQKQHATAIFFDLEKAYDTTWKFGILKDLHDTGQRGRLPLFIAGLLFDRKFQVRVGGSYSKLCEQEMGVTQGSILSVTLFCLKIN